MASKYARRHYEDVAALLKTHVEGALKSDTHYETNDLLVVEDITADFISLFTQDNPAFDADRFKKACGF